MIELAPMPASSLSGQSQTCWQPMAVGLSCFTVGGSFHHSKPSKGMVSSSSKITTPPFQRALVPLFKGPAETPKSAPSSPKNEQWLYSLISASRTGSFFSPCHLHKEFKKNEATLFCVDCSAGLSCSAMCQHCAPVHISHRTIQIRRYVYCDVVRAADIAAFGVDISGLQTYTINQAKVLFLNHRPQAKLLQPGAPEGCATCCRALREGCTYCSLACKVEALVRQGRLGPAAIGGAEAPMGHCPGASAAQASATAAAASDNSDCCTQPLGSCCNAPTKRSSCGGADRHSKRRTSPAAPAAAVAPAAVAAHIAWAAKRSSDSSEQSHLDWHNANGRVCRRKQASPRRSPLL